MASSQAQVAKLCKKHITGMGIKCTVKSESFAGGDSVRIEYEDQTPATHAKICAALAMYQYGKFDGMTDSYDYTNVNDNIPQTKWLTINNNFSPAMKQRAWEYICQEYNTDGMSANYSEVSATRSKIRGIWVQDFLWRFLCGTIDADESAMFWSVAQPPVFVKSNPTPPTKTVEAVTISEGTKIGYVEIRFPTKPDETERSELKAAGFRWSRYNGCWWGKAEQLPTTYQ